MQRLLARLDPYARKLGLYTAYSLASTEYVGRSPWPVWAQYSHLRANGYETIVLEAAKRHPETDEIHDASFRRVHPHLPQWQWHVHGWHTDDGTEWYSHLEYRPDPWPILSAGEGLRDMLKRLKTHYRPEVGIDYHRGAHDDAILEVCRA